MSRYFLYILVLFSCLTVFSQVEIEHNTVDHYGQGAPFEYLIADSVSLRELPAADSRLMLVLPIAAGFKILEKSENQLTIRGIKSAWYKIKLTDQRIGWIWGGYIATAAAGSNEDPELKFLVGYSHTINFSAKIIPVFQIKCIRNGIVVNRITFENNFSKHHFFEFFANKGLKGIHDIIRISCYHYPDKGPSGTKEFYFFWNGKELFKGMELTNTTYPQEHLFDKREYVFFPSDPEGTPDYVKFVKQGVDEKAATKSNSIVKCFKTTEYFEWNGVALAKAKDRKTEREISIHKRTK